MAMRRQRPHARIASLGVALLALLGVAALAVLAARVVRARAPLLDRVRAFNRRRLNPRMLRLAGRHGVWYQALRHVGRRSGRVYITPLEAFPIPGGFVIPMTYGLRADWARNALAAGGATLLWAGEEIPLTRPRVTRLADVAGAVPPIAQLGLRLLGVDELLALDVDAPPSARPMEGAE